MALAKWGWSASPSIIGSIEKGCLRNIVHLLAWTLSTTYIELRDKSSRALINILKNEQELILDFISTFVKVDDPYIVERVYAEFLKKYQPKYFVFENVLGLLSARDEDGSLHFDNMRALFKKCGYATDFRILNASDYGVLQNRKRIILIGFHGEKADFYPQIPVIKDAHKVGELFCDLPSIKAGEGVITPVKTTHYTGKYLFSARIKEYDGEPVTFHQARPNTAQDLEIYRIVVDTWNKSKTRVSYTDLPERLRTHNNTNSFLDRFKVVAGNLPYAQTVVAHISRDGHYFIHPDIKQNRSITPREAARIQTFPDNYFFESVTGRPSRTLAYKQIGNAVPVCLSYHIAHALLARFTGGDKNAEESNT